MNSGQLATCMMLALAGPLGAVEERGIIYRMHEDPDDPDSPVSFEVRLQLQPVSVFSNMEGPGGQVAWDILRVEISEMENGAPIRMWVDDMPYVNTLEGSWLTTHDDLEALQVSEFDRAAPIDGVAHREGMDEDLEYSFTGVNSDTRPMLPSTGLATYAFWIAKLEQVLAEGVEEPVDIFEDEDGG